MQKNGRSDKPTRPATPTGSKPDKNTGSAALYPVTLGGVTAGGEGIGEVHDISPPGFMK